ncbi:hypothetical protein SBC1_27940 [Caballeronia sp. SBC1]|uniref:hypothetical protein n=1 Tax=unclassified Caballeronia TaxID=2646786 RepID=UPI0013E1B69D|nr:MULTISPECIES: hypothetical protein [unclassified Caballeronia]QIE24760.1 hypothetical protein SBC2_28100 [Caballeronia sp. SBC2]QIN62778.1 hypothetical protein SBC1_27940 [Caballeronia sp. SBC1]
MKSINRHSSLHRVLALLIASAACSAWPSAHAAGADAGTRDFTAEEKLLGGPDTYGATYADPYGQAPAGNRAKGAAASTSAEKMMNDNADPAQTNASFVTPGTVAMKPSARMQVRDAGGKLVATPDDAAHSVYSTTGLKPAAKKTTEIYRSPY